MPCPNVAGRFVNPPQGVILHGSRSGRPQSAEAEYQGTAAYATQRSHGLGWHATIGPLLVATHIDPQWYGYHARSASTKLLGVEFAQPTVNDPINDGMVEAFVWWFINHARKAWPSLPTYFPTHAEVDRSFGFNDFKSDVYPHGDDRASELRARILARLTVLGVK